MVWAPAPCTALTCRADRRRGIKVDAAVVGESLCCPRVLVFLV